MRATAIKYVVAVAIGVAFLPDPLNLRIGIEDTAQAGNENTRDAKAVPQHAINSPRGIAEKDSSPLLYVTSHSCIDSAPPTAPRNFRVSKISLLRRVGPLDEPVLTVLPLTTPGLRPGWVILHIDNLNQNLFTPSCTGVSGTCLGPDRYVIEESTTPNFTSVSWSTETSLISASPFDRPVFRGLYGESRFYRIRLYPGAKTRNGCVLRTNVTQAMIPEQVRVRIANRLVNASFSQYTDQNIVRIRVGLNLNQVHTGGTTYEKLARGQSIPSQPQPMCVASKGTQVASQTGVWPAGGGTEVLDDGLITNPGTYIHIGLGNWTYSPGGLEGCATNWLKRPYFLNPDDGTKLIHRFVEFDLQRRFGTTVIDFTSDSANRVIVVSGTNSGMSIPSAIETLPTKETLPDGNVDPINPRY